MDVQVPCNMATNENHTDNKHGIGCSVRKAFRKSSAVGGCVCHRERAVLLTDVAHRTPAPPGSLAGDCADSAWILVKELLQPRWTTHCLF